ncbi:MAG: FG-GAP-like repeat-containing protein [Polyangiales bacterium]
MPLLFALFLAGCPGRAASTDATIADRAETVTDETTSDQLPPDMPDSSGDALDVPDASDAVDARDVMNADAADALDAADVGDASDADASGMDVAPRDVPPRDVPPFTPFDVTSADVLDAGDSAQPPRLVGPLHATRVTSQRPTLRWELPTGTIGARIELCRDRECTRMLGVIDAVGASVRPPTELPAGVVFWRARPITASGVGTRTSYTWEFWVGWRSAPIDTSYGVMKDFNGDGFDDVAVGANESPPESRAGRVYIYNGGFGGLDPTPQAIDNPDAPEPYFGKRLSPAGDVNGDGYADLLVSGYFYRSLLGRAYLYLGGPSGFTQERLITIDSPVVGAHGFGDDLTAGDFNGDGFSDIVIATGTGYVYFYQGSSVGTDPRRGVLIEPAVDNRVAAIGDTDGDGYCDLIAGDDDPEHHPHLLFGAPTGFRTDVEIPTIGQGYSVASAGDMNGDGLADFLIDEDGGAYLYLGARSLHPPSPARAWSVVIPGPSPTARGTSFGALAGDPGDLNGDGYSDFVFGYVFQSRAYVYLGGSELPRAPNNVLAGSRPYAFAIQPSCVGDVDGDGLDDAIIGDSPTIPLVGEYLHVFLGAPFGLSAIPSQIIISPYGPSSWTEFGDAIATRELTRCHWRTI